MHTEEFIDKKLLQKIYNRQKRLKYLFEEIIFYKAMYKARHSKEVEIPLAIQLDMFQ